MRKHLLSLMLLLFTISITAVNCRDQRSTGEKIEDAAEDVADDVEDAVDDVGDAVEDVADDN